MHICRCARQAGALQGTSSACARAWLAIMHVTGCTFVTCLPFLGLLSSLRQSAWRPCLVGLGHVATHMCTQWRHRCRHTTCMNHEHLPWEPCCIVPRSTLVHRQQRRLHKLQQNTCTVTAFSTIQIHSWADASRVAQLLKATVMLECRHGTQQARGYIVYSFNFNAAVEALCSIPAAQVSCERCSAMFCVLHRACTRYICSMT
jgi:hypothetical protein